MIGIKLAAEFINSQSKQLGEVDPLRLALQSKAHRDVIHVIDENGITIGLKKNPFYSSKNGSSNNVDNISNDGGVDVDGVGGGTTLGSSSGVVIDLDGNDLDGSSKDNGRMVTKTVRIDRDVDDDHGDDIDDLMGIDDDGGFLSSESISSSSDKMNNNHKISNYKNKGARDSNNPSKSQVRGGGGGGGRGGGKGGKGETTATATVDFDSNGSSDAASDVDLISSHSNDSPTTPTTTTTPFSTRDLELSLSSVPLSLLPIVPTLPMPSSSSSSSSIPMIKNPMLNDKTITSILSMRDHYNNDDDIIDGFYDNHNSNDEVQREKNLFKSHYQHDVENLQLLMSQMTGQSSSSSLHHKNVNPIRWIKDKASSALERKQQQHHHHQQKLHQDNNTTNTQRRKSFSGGDIGQYDDDGDGGSSSSGIGAKGITKISSDSSGNRATSNKFTTRATTIINPDRTVMIGTDTMIRREKTHDGGIDMDISIVKGSVRSNSTVNNQL
jgi:hypothetical protein